MALCWLQVRLTYTISCSQLESLIGTSLCDMVSSDDGSDVFFLQKMHGFLEIKFK